MPDMDSRVPVGDSEPEDMTEDSQPPPKGPGKCHGLSAGPGKTARLTTPRLVLAWEELQRPAPS